MWRDKDLNDIAKSLAACDEKNKLKQIICNPLFTAIIGGLIVGAILIFIFQPLKQNNQEKRSKQKEAQQSQQPNR